jgi:hypothetical protein
VAVSAQGELQPDIFWRLEVALGALHGRVGAVQRKLRLVVVEALEAKIVPRRLIVTARACSADAEPALVRILVTGRTRPRQAEESGRASGVGLRVAFVAGRRLVGTVERPARQHVIEFGPIAPRPADLLRPNAEVLDVAFLAGLALVLQPVQPLPCGDSCTQIAVTLQTGRLIDALAGAMAIAAVGISLDGRVRARESSGREQLRARHARERGHHQDRQSADCPPEADPVHRVNIQRKP